MKVGILTFHNAYNYGAVLQAYATQEIVKSYGHEVEIIDYHNKAVDYHYESRKLHLYNLPIRKFYQLPFYFIEKLFYWKRRKEYHKFTNNYLQLSHKKYYQEKTNSFSQYDIIIVGSDQVWNKKITGGFDKSYWGEYTSTKDTQIIAWSVCMNNLNLKEPDVAFIKEHLKNFKYISVRESSLQAYLSQLTDKKVYHTLDPTLVLPASRWENLCHNVKERNYIAVYAVRKESNAVIFAREVARIKKKPLIILRAYSRKYWGAENKEYASPTDFISYIKNADLVISTSFHGTAFSIIFEKQFICPVFEENSRISSLLESMNLSDRFVHQPEEVAKIDTIDYKKISPVKSTLLKETENFLDTIFRVQ